MVGQGDAVAQLRQEPEKDGPAHQSCDHKADAQQDGQLFMRDMLHVSHILSDVSIPRVISLVNHYLSKYNKNLL